MNDLKLILPCEEYLESFYNACIELKDAGITSYALEDPAEYDQWKDTLIGQYADMRNGRNLREGIVPSTTFWLVEDGEFIACGNIRHRLNANLERFGGHIGYYVRCSRWGKGYGTLLLGLLLNEAHKLGIETALLTCGTDNIASARVMEKNGGVLKDTIENTIDGKPRMTRRYLISTGK